MFDMLKYNNVIMDGHWKLASGRHAKLYVNKDRAYCNPYVYHTIIDEMAHKIQNSGINVDVITGPAVAGLCLASPISIKLNKVFVYPEKKMKVKIDELPMMDGERRYEYEMISTGMEFRRGYDDVIRGKRVFLTEDVITTGTSVEQTIMAIQNNGGIIVGVIAIWNRTNWSHPNCPTYSLVNAPVESWTEEECPLCKDPKNPLRDPKAVYKVL